jgi:hypothetical protein
MSNFRLKNNEAHDKEDLTIKVLRRPILVKKWKDSLKTDLRVLCQVNEELIRSRSKYIVLVNIFIFLIFIIIEHFHFCRSV